MFELDFNVKIGEFDFRNQYLLTRRLILSGDVSELSVRNIAQKMLILEHLDSTKDISLIIDSYGGDPYDSLFLIDFIGSLKCDVSTIVAGKAMSSGFMVAIAGTKGKRYITKYSTMMNHQISADAIGKLHEMESEVGECKRIEKLMTDIIKQKTRCPKRILDRCISKDVYFSASECFKYGFVDKIIEQLPTIKKRRTESKKEIKKEDIKEEVKEEEDKEESKE